MSDSKISDYKIVSEGGRFTAVVQPVDGNLVVYDNATGAVIWDAMSGRYNKPNPDAPWPLLGPEPQPPASRPPTPVVPGWPRRGASYYTSVTDPRVDPREWATRLQDAGCNLTRGWLTDAWAFGKGTGCYEGFVPWSRLNDGRWDLGAISGSYLDRLRAYVEAMNERGILPLLTGLELYSWSRLKEPLQWVPDVSQGPFRNNVQGRVYREHDEDTYRRLGTDDTLPLLYREVVKTLQGLVWEPEIGNEMPEKALHYNLAKAWREAGYAGRIHVNRQEDTPGQYDNMQIGGNVFGAIAYHGKRTLDYLDEEFPREPRHKTFQQFFEAGQYDASRITLSSDGCRRSTDVNNAYDYDALKVVAQNALARKCSFEHQSRLKLPSFTDGILDLNYLETDWLLSVWG